MNKEMKHFIKDLPFEVDMKRIRKLTEDTERDMKRQRKLIRLEERAREMADRREIVNGEDKNE
jgi:hypothetical protein